MNKTLANKIQESLTNIKDRLSIIEGGITLTNQHLNSIDKRLELIEKRLNSIEPFIPVDNSGLKYIPKSLKNGRNLKSKN